MIQMAELVLRARHNDHVVLTELLTDPSALPPRLARLVRRVVVDATAVVNQPAFAAAARASGTQLLIDPQTHFMTTAQAPGDSWARLPYATGAAMDPRVLLDPVLRNQWIEEVVEFQLDHGATAIIPPYLHLTDFASTAARVQTLLVEGTADHLVDLGLNFPLMPIVSVDQRAVSLEATAWASGLGQLIRSIRPYATAPIGLALSMTNGPNKTNLHNATRIWRRVARLSPFIAWHAGETGLLALAMGADGYEVGMCTSERYNARSEQTTRGTASVPGPRYTGAFVESLGRSLDRGAVERLSKVHGMHQGELLCVDPACCPRGFDSMLGAGRRQHAVRARLRDLEDVAAISARGWRLRFLANKAAASVSSARRIRAAANNTGERIGAYPAEHEAMLVVTQNLISTARITGTGAGA